MSAGPIKEDLKRNFFTIIIKYLYRNISFSITASLTKSCELLLKQYIIT